jgi:hypothetical protein
MGMTWIAACSGQRGIYQETIMTDEERRNLITDLKAARPGYPPGELCVKAADEIERLRFKSHEVVMWTDIDLAADEIERLASIVEDYKMTFGDIHEVVMGAGITHD